MSPEQNNGGSRTASVSDEEENLAVLRRSVRDLKTKKKAEVSAFCKKCDIVQDGLHLGRRVCVCVVAGM